jgi:AmmeMemoRadiSam system protein B
MRRRAVVAGTFYPGRKPELLKTLQGLTDPQAVKVKAVAVISPHAGYRYSGAVAGAVFSSVAIPEAVIVLGAPHADFRPRFSVMSEGLWESPLGDVPIDRELADLVIRSSKLAEAADSPHEDEHSIEVQVPFLQYLQKNLSLVPVHVNARTSFEDLQDLARGLASAVKEYAKDVLIVASTDMSHYIDQESAKKLDGLAIDRVLALDARGLFDTVRKNRISMCGYQPTTAAILAARDLGAMNCELVKYQTSGDVTGDRANVVGYAGLRIY